VLFGSRVRIRVRVRNLGIDLLSGWLVVMHTYEYSYDLLLSVDIVTLLFGSRIRIRIRVRVRNRFIAWLVSSYAHVFVRLLVDIVTRPLKTDQSLASVQL